MIMYPELVIKNYRVIIYDISSEIELSVKENCRNKDLNFSYADSSDLILKKDIMIYIPVFDFKQVSDIIGVLCNRNGQKDTKKTSEIIQFYEKPAEGSNQKSPKVYLVGVCTNNWNDDLSPWPAEKVFSGGENFGGKADEFLKIMESDIIPVCEAFVLRKLKESSVLEESLILQKTLDADNPAELDNMRFVRGICGYSMAGLFSIYVILKSKCFSFAGSVSGSLWFDGFSEYIERETKKKSGIKEITKNEDSAAEDNDLLKIGENGFRCLYVSLGDKESKVRNKRMSQNEVRTLKIFDSFCAYAQKHIFVMNKGGHFDHADIRMADAIVWLIKETVSLEN